MASEDVSRTTVIVLVILAVLVSLISTWLVFYEVNSVTTTKTVRDKATVSFDIQSPNQIKEENKPNNDQATANVVFSIAKTI